MLQSSTSTGKDGVYSTPYAVTRSVLVGVSMHAYGSGLREASGLAPGGSHERSSRGVLCLLLIRVQHVIVDAGHIVHV